MNTKIFDKNLDALATSHPAIANKMRSLVPVEIDYDDLLNDLIVQGERFYGQNSHSACAQQVSLFFRKPAHFSLKLTENGRPFTHQKVINNLSDQAARLGYRQNTKPQLANLILLGSGIGQQIPLLSRHLKFHNIILLEPNDEMLFHFLQHTDVQALQESLAERGGTFRILQSQDREVFMGEFKQLLQYELGFGFLAEVTVFRHYETPLFDHILEQFRPIRQKLLSNWGYFEDELDGVRHTFENLNVHPFFKQDTTPVKPLKPVILVGNGPSLDQHLRLLREHQDKFTVVSCGTAIAALLNSDIVPDIHMEMERSQFTVNVQQKWLNSAQLKNVFFVGLSTVSPKITKLFKHAILFSKANDLGTYLLNTNDTNQYPPLYFCNPTVTNFALAASIQLGFKAIYLLGCDYGYRDEAKHHSQSSDYYASAARIGYTPQDTHRIVDNFGNPMSTTRIFDIARQNVEKLLAKHPDIKVTNCSDGAAIQHTQWQSFSETVSSCASHNSSDAQSTTLVTQQPASQHSAPTPNLTKTIGNLVSYNKVIDGLRQLLDGISQPQQLLTECKNLIIAAEKRFLKDQSNVIFIGDLRYYNLLLSSHIYRLTEVDLSRYLQCVAEQLEQAINAYQEILINLDNGDNS